MINKENWKENYTHISNEVIDNEKVLRVIKSGKINEYDENTYAKLVDSSFHICERIYWYCISYS